ncbi:unnamed protein product [Citrullus colocynthis]|uniref:Uncharacterized protein n=1 Tax=Citrullus colocynthis TaxID=252529 RepID=A0ABP0XNL6_9ROSI
MKKKQKRWPSARRDKEGPMQTKLPVSSALSFLIFLTSVSCESLPIVKELQRVQSVYHPYGRCGEGSCFWNSWGSSSIDMWAPI